MYILFINSGGKYDIYFSAQFNNNSNKKNCPIHVGWVGLGWIYVIGWVGLNFFLTHHGVLG